MSAPRSLLYVPASKPAMLVGIAKISADAFVIDLEDGVAETGKSAARDNLVEWMDAAGPEKTRVWIRINAATHPEHVADVEMVESLFPAGVLLPKAEDARDLSALRERFGPTVRIGAMIETARGVAEAFELAAACEMLVLGSADLRSSLGARADDARDWERASLDRLLLAARANGASAIDSVYFRFRDEEGLRRHTTIARNLGYDGASCIHPAQISVIHDVYAPSTEELAWAEQVLEAWQTQDGEHRGVVVMDGEMIEALHVRQAQRLLARRSPEAKS